MQTIAQSDHAIVSLMINPNKVKKGPGFWRLDASLLERDDFEANMTDLLSDWKPPAGAIINMGSIWEWLKFQIQNHAREFARKNRSLEKQQIKSLYKEINDLHQKADDNPGDGQSDNIMSQIESIRRELAEMEEARARKTIFRSRCNWSMYGEWPTKYFLNLEKRKSADRTLNTVIAQDGTTLTDLQDILQEGKSFYEHLYRNDEDSLMPIEEIEQLIPNLQLPQLPQEDRDSLDSPFSQEELCSLPSQHRQVPGYRWQPARILFQILAPPSSFFCSSLESSIHKGTLSASQRGGIITLVPKKDTDKCFIANWRPITPLNTDYKNYTKAIGLRLQRVMSPLIDQDQTGFMKRRLVGDSVRNIEDNFRIIQRDHPSSMLVALDFKKAFDSVRWPLIFATLRWLNFGEAFINFIRIMFSNIESCVANSGFSSPFFSPERGIRQGCCASPYLFNLVVEILATLIRSNTNIRGIQHAGKVAKT